MQTSLLSKRKYEIMEGGGHVDGPLPQRGASLMALARTTLEAALVMPGGDSKQELSGAMEAVEQAFDSPGRLNLSKLPRSLAQKIAMLDGHGWKALDTLGNGIREIVLPAHPQGPKPEIFCEGLEHLDSLQKVLIAAPPEGKTAIDLGALKNPQLKTIEIQVGKADGNPITDAHFRVRAPDGTDVFATGSQRPSQHKSLVTYVKDGKDIGGACVLRGMPYYRQAKDLVNEGMTPSAADRKALQTNHNFVVKFPGTDEYISCKHLATHWLDVRHKYNTQKALAQSTQDGKAAKPAFDISHFKTEESIRQHIDQKSVEAVREALLAQKDWTDDLWFCLSTFGAKVASEFDGLKNSAPKLFGLSLNKHFMAFELQMKAVVRGSKESVDYVMTLYDPNGTRTHARLAHGDPQRFLDRSLEDWVGTALMRQYHPDDRHKGIFYPYPPITESQALAGVLTKPQHAWAGHPVEIADGDEHALEQCRTQQLRTLPGAGPHMLLCVCNGLRGIDSLKGHRVDASSLERQGIPLAAAYQASRADGAIYLIPPDKLRLRSVEDAPPSKESNQ